MLDQHEVCLIIVNANFYIYFFNVTFYICLFFTLHVTGMFDIVMYHIQILL